MHTTRYAHCEGYTDICLAENGTILTTGEDGDVRVWQGYQDIDNKSIRVGDKCFALAYKSGKIYVADELNEVKRFDIESEEQQGVITSFTLPVTSIAINKSNTYLVCGSSDFEIHLVDLKTLKFSSFTGHAAPILHLCFDPLEKFFVSSSCDGTARFWSVNTLNTAKTLSNLHPKSNDFSESESLCKIAWHKDGTLIAVPCFKEIHFYERETWICKFKINIQNDKSEDFLTSILCFSPDGQLILATTSDQMIYMHSIVNKAMVFKYSYTKKSKLTSLVWNPLNKDEILFCDIKGYMGQIKGPFEKGKVEEKEKEKEKPTKKGRIEYQDDNLDMADLLDLMESDSKDSDFGKKSSSKSRDEMKSPIKKRKRISDEESTTTDKSETNADDVRMDDDDDDEMISLEKLKSKAYETVKKEIMGSAEELEEDEGDDVKLCEEKNTKFTNVMPSAQPAFQASSTSLTLTERYMVWNSVGLITQFMKDGDESIDIEFHNASYHHTIHLKNQFGYTMGDISKEAIVLASPGKIIEEELESNATLAVTSQSKLTCILINPCDNHKEWSVEMPRKEYIKSVCVSRSLLACMTSRRFLRVFGIAGIQKEIISLNGSPLAMSAFDNCLFVTYVASPLAVNYSIYYFNEDKEAEHGVLPLSENAKLEWLGFSDEGNPYFYDSNGYLYAKCLTLSKTSWTPLSDMRSELKHKTDNYWIVGIAERNKLIKAILCRGSKYPLVLPRPNLSMVNITIPFCEPDSEKTQMERDYWKNKYLSLNFKNYDWSSGNLDLDQDECDEKLDQFEASSKEILMKLFMSSCKSGKEQRGYEVATIMDSISLQLAIKYATRTRALALAQNLNLLAEKKAAEEYEKERQKLEEEYSKPYQVRNYFY